jgi:hypothetical protein
MGRSARRVVQDPTGLGHPVTRGCPDGQRHRRHRRRAVSVDQPQHLLDRADHLCGAYDDAAERVAAAGSPS